MDRSLDRADSAAAASVPRKSWQAAEEQQFSAAVACIFRKSWQAAEEQQFSAAIEEIKKKRAWFNLLN